MSSWHTILAPIASQLERNKYIYNSNETSNFDMQLHYDASTIGYEG